jgi:hypothetical protein
MVLQKAGESQEEKLPAQKPNSHFIILYKILANLSGSCLIKLLFRSSEEDLVYA